MARLGPVTVVSVPVADQDRAKAFYVETLRFSVDHDVPMSTMRWLQLTPPGGGTSFALVTWFEQMPPGSLRGVVLDTDDIEAKRNELIAKGLEVTPIDRQPYGSFAMFDDLDGNGFVLMQPPGS